MNRGVWKMVFWLAALSVAMFHVRSFAATAPINLELAWTDDSADKLGFIVERSLSASGPWQFAGFASPNSPSFLDVNLRAGTDYHYRVKTFNANTVSEPSDVVRITTPKSPKPPRFKRSLAGVTADLGSAAELSPDVSGNPPFKFQWRHHGTNMPGANGRRLKWNSVSPSDAGDYSLIISNAEGVVASSSARVTVLAPVAIGTTGQGKVASLKQGQKLELGRSYKIGAVAAKGHTFAGWRINGTNGPATRTLSFVMRPGIELVARFREATPPTLIARNLKSGAKLSVSSFPLTGTATDNVAVNRVMYQVNEGPWLRAHGTTDWQADLWLKSGANRVRVFAADAAGNESRMTTLNVTSLTATNNTPLLSTPSLAGVRLQNGVAAISVPSVSGLLYELLCKDSLQQPEWQPVPFTLTPGNGNILELFDENAPATHRFYIVRASTRP